MQVHERRVARRLREAVRHADHDRFLQPEDVPESSGKSLNIGSSVEPGLPKTMVIPKVAEQASGGIANREHAEIMLRKTPSAQRALALRDDSLLFREDVSDS